MSMMLLNGHLLSASYNIRMIKSLLLYGQIQLCAFALFLQFHGRICFHPDLLQQLLQSFCLFQPLFLQGFFLFLLRPLLLRLLLPYFFIGYQLAFFGRFMPADAPVGDFPIFVYGCAADHHLISMCRNPVFHNLR